MDQNVRFSAIKCRYINCIPPVSPAIKAPINERPANALLWSDPETWRLRSEGIPADGQNVTIPLDTYVVVDTVLPKMNILVLDGALELDNGRDHRLEADLIFINGGQLIVGWENDPILTNVEIVLTGEKNSLSYDLPNGFQRLGSKTIGVYGGLDIHGAPRTVQWTQLASSALNNTNTITLVEPVDWQAGEEIVITTTTYVLEQTETAVISAVSADNLTLTLTAGLGYDHLAYGETFADGTGYQIAAGVGLLSRNVKVIGVEYALQQQDLYGARIHVADYSTIYEDVLLYYKGFVRLENFEMVNPG